MLHATTVRILKALASMLQPAAPGERSADWVDRLGALWLLFALYNPKSNYQQSRNMQLGMGGAKLADFITVLDEVLTEDPNAGDDAFKYLLHRKQIGSNANTFKMVEVADSISDLGADEALQ